MASFPTVSERGNSVSLYAMRFTVLKGTPLPAEMTFHCE